SRQLARVAWPKCGILHVSHNRGCRTERGDTPLNRIQVETTDCLPEREGEKRHFPFEDRSKRVVTSLHTQIGRIQALGSDRNVGLGAEALFLAECLERRLLSSFVWIKREDHLGCRVIAHNAAKYGDMFLP